MMMTRVAVLWILAVLHAAAQPPLPHSEVFEAGQQGYHTFRIPALLQTQRGTLLAFAEGRRANRSDWGDIDVLVKRSFDGGRTWSEATVVADFGADTIGNPAPVLDRKTGVVWLLLTKNPGNVPERSIQTGLSGPTRTVWVTHSQDDGVTWSKPEDITATTKKAAWSWYATGPVNGIQTRSGRLVIPCDHDKGDASQHYSHVIYSDDHGKSWKLGGEVGPDANESTVAELTDGTLVLNMRCYRKNNRRLVARSRDGGLTWTSPVEDLTLVEPVCQGSLLQSGSGRRSRLLFANPAATQRMNLTVRSSRDGGQSWSKALVVHAGPAAYSNLVEVDRTTIGLLYERGDNSPYERISFVRIPRKSLE